MKLVFSALDEPAANRTEYWQHVVSDTVAPLSLDSGGALGAGDRIVAGDIGAVRVGTLAIGSPGSASRTARHIRQYDPDLCKIDVLVRGRAVVQQGGRQARLAAGDLTFVDLSQPASWAFSTAQVVAVVFPRQMLPLRPDETARLTAVRIPGDQGSGALAAALARQLPGHLADHPPASAPRLGSAMLDLIAATLAEPIDGRAALPADTRRSVLLREVLTFIERHLGDPDLTPATIAAAHHISIRSLHALFTGESLPVAQWVRRRRMEQCRRDLLDPAMLDRPVSGIAARWGIRNAAQFSRQFRTAYGLPPAEFRSLHAPATSPHASTMPQE